ncbi:hypothetical protein ACJX0J_036367 [Zea mays]
MVQLSLVHHFFQTSVLVMPFHWSLNWTSLLLRGTNIINELGIVIDSITLIGRSLRLAFLLTWSCVLIFASLLTILFFSDVAFFFFFEFWKIIEKTMKHLIIGIVIDSCVVCYLLTIVFSHQHLTLYSSSVIIRIPVSFLRMKFGIVFASISVPIFAALYCPKKLWLFEHVLLCHVLIFIFSERHVPMYAEHFLP